MVERRRTLLDILKTGYKHARSSMRSKLNLFNNSFPIRNLNVYYAIALFSSFFFALHIYANHPRNIPFLPTNVCTHKDNSFLQGDPLDSDSSCEKWSSRAALLPSNYTSIYHSIHMNNLLRTVWLHNSYVKSNADSAQSSYITQCLPHPHHLPSTLKSTSLSSEDQEKLQFQQELLLCNSTLSQPVESTSTVSDLETPNGTTIALLLPHDGGSHADELPTSPEGPNLWHFHASAFQFWLALHLPRAIAYAHKLNLRNSTESNVNVSPPSIGTATHVLIMLPFNPCIAAQLSRTMFEVTPASLRMERARGASTSALESLQGLADALAPRVFVACQKAATAKRIINGLHLAGYPPVKAVVVPPPGGFMWDLPSDTTLDSHMRENNCSNSLLQQYADAIRTGYKGTSRSMKKEQRNDKQKNDKLQQDVDKVQNSQLPHSDPIATHVCFISRQVRSRPGGDDRGNLRNLEADFMRRLMIRLGGPIVLSFSSSLRDDGARLIPAHLDSASISGQLRFVHAECAVIIGVHGAGLTNALGLTRGTAVIEMIMHGKSYYYFRNVAALLDDTTYDVVHVMGNQGTESGVSEKDLYLDDDGLEKLVKLVRKRLDESLDKQEQMRRAEQETMR